jgi:hypothetical protein
MNNCPNCQKEITCGCQKKLANDGTQVCTSCMDEYNKLLGVKNQQPLVNNAIPTAPSNVKVLYTPPRRTD